MNIQYFYRKDTLQIDAVFRDCQTNSAVFKDINIYAEVNVENPKYTVSRNHKVQLDAQGSVIGTLESVNPVQPSPPVPPRDYGEEIDDLKLEVSGLKNLLTAK